MKEIIVKNYRKIPAQVQNQGNNQFSVKPIIEDITKCSANFVEVEPGNFAYGYHYQKMKKSFILSAARQWLKRKKAIFISTLAMLFVFRRI